MVATDTVHRIAPATPRRHAERVAANRRRSAFCFHEIGVICEPPGCIIGLLLPDVRREVARIE
jgi:hypothetical protein